MASTLRLSYQRAFYYQRSHWFGLILLWMVSTAIAITSVAACTQEASQDPGARLDQAIRKVHEECKDYLEEKKKLVETYESLQTSIQQTEAEWNRIQNEGVIKQFAAIQSAMNSMQISNSIGSINSTPGGNDSPNDLAVRQQLQQQLMLNRMMENMNTFMRSQELQQLGVEAQRTIRTRFETIQKIMKVEEDYRRWQSSGNRFFEKYWKYTDPQKSFSSAEVQSVLKALQDRDKDNFSAELAEALLLANQGDYSQSKQLLDPLTQSEGPLQPIALMCKALVLEGMEKERDSKLAMQQSIKLDRTNPYCRWLRARLAYQQDQINIAETEWKAVSTNAAMQADAKRALALLYAQRVSKTPSNAGRAVTLATEALESETPATWFSHFTLAVALHAAKKKDEALEQIESAKKLAAEERHEICNKLKEAIETDQAFKAEL